MPHARGSEEYWLRQADTPTMRAVGRWRALLAVVGLGYLALWGALAGLPFQDIPNHLSRAIVIGDLLFDGGRRFGDTFTFEWLAIPYILGDVLMLPLARWLPPDVAGRALVILEWVSLPLAVAFLLHAWRASPGTRVIALALSLYLATDIFFVMGFANFRFAVALVLVGVATWEWALRTRAWHWWTAYFVVAGLGYLMHLSALVFLIAAVGSLSVLRLYERREKLTVLLVAGVPLLLLLGWHLLGQEPLNGAPAVQPTAQSKLLRLGSPLVRFRDLPDLVLFGAFAATALAVVLLASRRGLDTVERELAVLTVAFVGVYFALPESQGLIWAIDNRALALAWMWLALLAAFAAPRLGRGSAVAGLALALAAANLALLAVQLLPEDAHMREYRALAAQVPANAVVLPVVTQPHRGFTNPTAHAASFATIDRDASVPYTFSGDAGMPMRYFRFRHRPEAPGQFWYQHGYAPEGGSEVLGRYPYLLVELPADWSRIPVHGRIVQRNAAAALVATGAAVAAANATPEPAHGGR